MKRVLICLGLAIVSTTASAACPTGAQLVALAQSAFAELADAQPEQLACQPLRAHAPTWLITFANAECGSAAAIVEGGAVTWHQGPDAPGWPCRADSWQAADLDGDGTDELLWIRDAEGHEGSSHRSLTVRSIVDGAPEAGDSLALASRGTIISAGRFSYDCSAQLRILPAAHGQHWLQLVGRGSVRADCPKRGRHVYAWKHGALVERS